MLELVNQVIYNILVNKDLDEKLFDYINPWGETLSSILWDIRESYQRNLKFTPGQTFFFKDMIFNLTPIVDLESYNPKKSGKTTLTMFEKIPHESDMTMK